MAKSSINANTPISKDYLIYKATLTSARSCLSFMWDRDGDNLLIHQIHPILDEIIKPTVVIEVPEGEYIGADIGLLANTIYCACILTN